MRQIADADMLSGHTKLGNVLVKPNKRTIKLVSSTDHRYKFNKEIGTAPDKQL